MAFVVCFLGFFSWMNIGIWPLINHFYVGYLFLGLQLCVHERISFILLRFSLVLAIGTWIRPESGIAALLALLLGLIFLFVEKGKQNRKIVDPISLWFAGLAIVVLFATKSIAFDPVRSGIAFAQHYAITKVETGKDFGNPWADPFLFFRKDFPTAFGISEAYLENPYAFKNHVYSNFKLWFEYLRFIPGDFLMPFPLFKISSIWANKIGMFLFLALIIFGFRHRVRGPYTFRFFSPKMGLAIALSCCALPLLFACIILHPRDHYIHPIFWFMILFFTLWLSLRIHSSLSLTGAMSICLIFIFSNPTYPYKPSPDSKPLKNFNTVKHLQAVKIDSGGMISLNHFFHPYIGPVCVKFSSHSRIPRILSTI